jgi:ribosome-associated toxin RatA of RatAB toxin-antitoxin module
MPTIENTIRIDAGLEHVYAIARDVESFPEFMPDVKSIHVRERSDDGRRTVVEWVGLIPEFKLTVKWTEEDEWNDAERTCVFRLVEGDFKEYHGLWRFTAHDGITRFDSSVTYDYELPLVGPLIKGVIRKKMLENLDRLQRAIKQRAEGG